MRAHRFFAKQFIVRAAVLPQIGVGDRDRLVHHPASEPAQARIVDYPVDRDASHAHGYAAERQVPDVLPPPGACGRGGRAGGHASVVF